jgi:hypothetical protein
MGPHEPLREYENLKAQKPRNNLFISLSHLVMPPALDGVLYLSCLAHLEPSRPMSVLGVPNPLLFEAVIFFVPPNHEEPFIKEHFIHATLHFRNECPPTDPAEGLYKLAVKVNVFM